ncbi:EthD domain-containing protein [Neobacillus mesonae]|uniref:EthD domain-containing protein n=1 Tax=Neobacillus mesonae TaxID=1193713 RepID=UPI00203F8CBB|nr:EthD domain-containing protein [Neobacillus mesonae]MCM3568095.1 EthD family reductase [Neobacillus mesonae]
MIKRTGILRKRDDISKEEFRSYWLETHGPLVRETLGQGVKAYHQNHVVNSEQLGINFPRSNYKVDGFSQITFNETTSMEEVFNEENQKTLKEDEPKFIGELQLVMTEPKIVVPPPENKPLIKRISLLKRRHDIDLERFKFEWLQVHAEYVLSMNGIEGYIQNLAINRTIDKKTQASYNEVPVDGIVELWFKDVESLEAAFQSENGQRTMNHAKEFLDEITTFIVEDHKIV